MARSKKVSSLIDEKRKISKKIDDLQNKCKHLNKVVKSIQENEASTTFVIRWVCNDCEKIVGIPNEHELNKYLNGSR